MSDGTGPGAEPGKPLKCGRGRQSGPIPIWQGRLYRQRRARGGASGLNREQAGRFVEATLLQEKREFADRLFNLCDKADEVVRQRGGDMADELERIAELSFIVSYWDSETAPEVGVRGPFEHLGESRDCLAAMVLACEVARLAHTPGQGSQTFEDPDV
jgi:hypothetical protein